MSVFWIKSYNNSFDEDWSHLGCDSVSTGNLNISKELSVSRQASVKLEKPYFVH